MPPVPNAPKKSRPHRLLARLKIEEIIAICAILLAVIALTAQALMGHETDTSGPAAQTATFMPQPSASDVGHAPSER